MNILYVCPGKFQKSDGVYQKATKQGLYWSEKGNTVHVLTFAEMPEASSFIKFLLRINISYLSILIIYLRYSKLINEMCIEHNIDIIYSRQMLLPFFMKIPERTKLIIEINGDIVKQNSDKNIFFRWVVNKSIAYYDKTSSAIVLCTDGLKDLMPSIKIRSVLTNCVLNTAEEVEKNVKHKLEMKDEILKNKAICFMASKNRVCYDIDRIVRIFNHLDDDYKLWIVGDIKPKSVKNARSERIVFQGKKSGDELSKIILDSFACIGGVNSGAILKAKASPLKVRSYLEHATPTFAEDNDIDFNNGHDFYFGLDFSLIDDEKKIGDELRIFLSEVESFEYLEGYTEKLKPFCLEEKEQLRLDLFERVHQDNE